MLLYSRFIICKSLLFILSFLYLLLYIIKHDNRQHQYISLSSRRFLRSQYGKAKVDYGYQDNHILGNITLYSAMLIHDEISLIHSLHYEKSSKHSDILISNDSINNDHEVILSIINRRKTMRKFIGSLLEPIKIRKWPCIHSKPCPIHQSIHKHSYHNIHMNKILDNALNHLQIWLEFIFFDHDVIHASKRKIPEYITSNDYSSVSGIFSSYPNGTFYKNNRLILEEDVLLVLEDQIELHPAWNNSDILKHYYHQIYTDNHQILSSNYHNHSPSYPIVTLSEMIRFEISKIKTDLLIFGWESSNFIQYSSSNIKYREDVFINPIDIIKKMNSSSSSDTSTHTFINYNHNYEKEDMNMSIPMFAYAITRRGAKKLSKFYDPCHRKYNLHHQIYNLVKYNLISYSFSHYSLFISRDNIY